MTFGQKKWLKPNIDFNTELRSEAEKFFQEISFKILKTVLSGIFVDVGKTKRDVTARTAEEGIEIQSKQHKTSFFGDHLQIKFGFEPPSYCISPQETKNDLQKPMQIGFYLENLSKSFIYKRFYIKLKPCSEGYNLKSHLMNIDLLAISF